MPPQIVQYQEDFFARILDQGLQEFNKLVGIKCRVDDHPACLALIGYRGNHRELLAGVAYRHRYWGFCQPLQSFCCARRC